MKIGIIKETKCPVDNRVALTPEQIVALQKRYPDVEFLVQRSDIRAYHDDEYAALGIAMADDMSDCDVLFGIKEADISTLIPSKHYVFFGHVAKKQPYNQPLMRAMAQKGISFSDYEYFVDDENVRLCAFGWWAGVVGVYYSFRAYGLKYGKFDLPKPDLKFTLEELLGRLADVAHLCGCRVAVTGNGRVSQGAQYVLEHMKAVRLSPADYLSLPERQEKLVYTVLSLSDLVGPSDSSKSFDRADFKKDPSSYVSRFAPFSRHTDLLLSCHFWAPGQPVYLDEELLKDPEMSIRVIGDITCDIKGSIMSTVRSSTHDDPFYDFSLKTMDECPAFSDGDTVTVMAVDTCPNALAIDTSRYFGETLSEHVFPLIIEGRMGDPVMARATILKDGKLTERYEYLKEYAGQ